MKIIYHCRHALFPNTALVHQWNRKQDDMVTCIVNIHCGLVPYSYLLWTQ